MKLILSMKVAFFCAFAVIAAGLCPAAEELLTSPDAGKTIRVFLDEGNVLRVERSSTEVFQTEPQERAPTGHVHVSGRVFEQAFSLVFCV